MTFGAIDYRHTSERLWVPDYCNKESCNLFLSWRVLPLICKNNTTPRKHNKMEHNKTGTVEPWLMVRNNAGLEDSRTHIFFSSVPHDLSEPFVPQRTDRHPACFTSSGSHGQSG